MALLYDKLITDAFIRLCNEKSLSKVTMQDIANESHLARRTIYNHFADKYAIMQSIYQHRIQEALNIYDRTGSIVEPIGSFLKACYEHPEFYKSLISYKGQDDYIQSLLRDLYDNFVAILRNNIGENCLTEDMLFQIQFYCKAIATNFATWVLNDMPIPPDIYATRILKCLPKELQSCLELAKEKRQLRSDRSHTA